MFFGFYYSDYDSTKFLTQKTLNNLIENKECFLQTEEANPLTMRLLIAKEALDFLKREILNTENEMKKAINSTGTDPMDWNASNKIFQNLAGSAASFTQFDITSPQGLENKWFSFYSEKEKYYVPIRNAPIFRNIIAHMYLYNYFSNFSSILDRFAQEINILYDLNIDRLQVDWNVLRKISQEITINSHRKDPSITTMMEKFHQEIVCNHLKYRNRLVHDGLINFHVVPKNGKVIILLQKNPMEINSPFEINAIEFCENGFDNLLGFLDTAYGKFIKNINTYGQPPWVNLL